MRVRDFDRTSFMVTVEDDLGFLVAQFFGRDAQKLAELFVLYYNTHAIEIKGETYTPKQVEDALKKYMSQCVKGETDAH